MTAMAHRATTWPLLRKDLTEMAAQGRGYWLRAGVVALGYSGFAWMYHALGRDAHLGGIRSFETLNAFMAAAVTIFTPLVVASSIAGEKERNAFALLLVTPLTGRELLLEKFLARLIPLAGMMLCALPLYAVCYSHGGLEAATLVGVACLQLANLLLAGAVGLSASCRYPSTLKAVLMSWVFWGVLLVMAVAFEGRNWGEEIPFALFGVFHVIEAKFHPSILEDLWRLVWLLVVAFAMLLEARFFLVRHAFRKAGNRRLSLVRWLHRRLDWMTGRLRGGSMLPGKKAFLWREMHRLGIATFRFKVRLAVAALLTSFAVCIVVMLIALSCPGDVYFGLHVGIWIVMAVTATILGISAAQAETKCRTAETLALTPDGMAHALAARMSALTILLLLLLPALLVLPITGLLLLKYLMHPWSEALAGLALEIIPVAATFLVLPFFFLRYGFWFGTVFKGSARALATAVIIALLWIAGIEFFLEAVGDYSRTQILESMEAHFQISNTRPPDFHDTLEGYHFWMRLGCAVKSPAGLPMHLIESRKNEMHDFTGVYTILYLFLGMLLQHRALHRVRKRYG